MIYLTENTKITSNSIVCSCNIQGHVRAHDTYFISIKPKKNIAKPTYKNITTESIDREF